MTPQEQFIEWFKKVDPYQYDLAVARMNMRAGQLNGWADIGATIWEGVKTVGAEVGKAAASTLTSAAKAKIEAKIAAKYGTNVPPVQVPQQVSKNTAVVNQQLNRVAQGLPPLRQTTYVPPIRYTGTPEQKQDITTHAGALETSAPPATESLQKMLPWLTLGFLAFRMFKG